jgi:hypothetical protein
MGRPVAAFKTAVNLPEANGRCVALLSWGGRMSSHEENPRHERDRGQKEAPTPAAPERSREQMAEPEKERAEGRDRAPAGRGRAGNQPWLGGG